MREEERDASASFLKREKLQRVKKIEGSGYVPRLCKGKKTRIKENDRFRCSAR